jgi:hypothetical protein
MTSRLYSVSDRSRLQGSAEVAVDAARLGALRHALGLLLRDREPQGKLSAIPAAQDVTLPAGDWQAVLNMVFNGLLTQTSEIDASAAPSAFNALAGVEAGASSETGTLVRRDTPLQIETTVTHDDSYAVYETPVSISIRAPEARTLRVIRQLPAFRLCQLEGRNGIGKTLAARLLELISGAQPYSGLPHAWTTLKGQLGTTTITVDGLSAGQLEVTLTPGEWPDQPDDSLGDLLGSVKLNDAQIEWSRARDLLQVVRIAGDESLVDALARALDERAQQALRSKTAINGKVNLWYAPFFGLHEITGSLSTEHFVGLLNDATAAKHVAEEQQREVEIANEVTVLAQRTLANLQRALQRRDKVPVLIEQLADANAELAKNVASLNSVEQDLFATSKALGLDSSRRTQVARWERLRTLRYSAIRRAKSNEDWYLAQLGEDERPTWNELSTRKRDFAKQLSDAVKSITELDVTEDVRQLVSSIEFPLQHAGATVLRQVIATLDAPVTGKALLEGIRRRRAEIEGRPTPVEVQAAKSRIESLQRTVRLLASLESAMEATDRKKENVDEAEQKLHELLNQSERVSQEAYEEILSRLRKLQEDRAAYMQTRDGVRLSLARLLDMDIPESYESDSPTSMSRSLAEEEEAEEQGLLSGGTVPENDEQFVTALPGHEVDDLDLPVNADDWKLIWKDVCEREHEGLSALGYQFTTQVLREKHPEIAADELMEAAETAAINSREAVRVEGEKMAKAIESAAILERQQEQVTQARQRLRTSVSGLIGPGNDWNPWLPGFWRLLEVVGATQNDVEALDSLTIDVGEFDLADQEVKAIRWMEAISWLSGRISYASDGVRDGLDSIAGILQAQARALNPRRGSMRDAVDGGRPGDYKDIEIVRGWAEKDLALLLNAEALRRTLFDDASEVNLHLESATVSWTEPNSSYLNRRPLEAFSSGEQVFAYTRARLEQLKNDESWRGHRLVILDEFGAFVARNRFAQLLDFVHRQALGSIADQIIVMIPLSSDYANEAFAQELVRGASDESRRSDLLERIRQVQDHGYFAIPVGVTSRAAAE